MLSSVVSAGRHFSPNGGRPSGHITGMEQSFVPKLFSFSESTTLMLKLEDPGAEAMPLIMQVASFKTRPSGNAPASISQL